MNRRNTRAFAFGIFISVLLMGAYHFYAKTDQTAKMTVEKAKEVLTNDGLVVITKEEYVKLKETKKEAKEKLAEKEEKPAEKPTEKQEVKQDSPVTYTIKIKSGMNPQQIADQLAKEKIVDDADDFATYLEEYGYSTKIQLGIFELTNKMSYKDIAKIITKS